MADDYATFFFVGDLPEVRASLKRMEAAYRTSGRFDAAAAVGAALDYHMAALTAFSIEVATVGTELVREMERSTRVRPDTGGRGGERLEDNLHVESLSFEGLPGSVGFVNESKLDSHVPWWGTNEEGSNARVGGKVVGFFDGGYPPNPLEFRQHAVFQPRADGGLMTIRRPIPARRFVLKSIPEFRALWRDGFDALKAQLIAEVAAAEFL